MNITIRQEVAGDYKSSEIVIEKAFENAEHTDHKEQFLVARLRKSEVFIPELSLVAELDREIVGHVLLIAIYQKWREKL
jgi:predicted N-acetyltransferase YhbS